MGNAEPTTIETSARPCRADGLVLLGEFAGSGLSRPVFLARRRDGQIVTLTELLARIVEAADGTRDLDEIAETAAARGARAVSGADVAQLLAHQLMPLGLIYSQSGQTPQPRARALLALTARHTLLPASVVYRLSALFAVFFRPAVMTAALALVATADAWLFGRHSVRDSAAALLADPSMILLLVGLALACALFHECGHAAACRYGGARPGVIGIGMYLVWPAFFTDVTDSYRLSRQGRLRTDLGGVYFNGLFSLALAGMFALTHAEVLVTAVLLVHADALRQLSPFVRLDGYYVVSDLAGVPDLFSRMGPAARSGWRTVMGAVPWRRRPAGQSAPDPRLTSLTRRARLLVTAWAMCTVPVLAVNIVMLLVYAPFVLPRTALAVRDQFGEVGPALAAGRPLAALAATVNTLLVALPAIGMTYVIVRLGRGLARALVTACGRRRAARLARPAGCSCAARSRDEPAGSPHIHVRGGGDHRPAVGRSTRRAPVAAGGGPVTGPPGQAGTPSTARDTGANAPSAPTK